MKPDHSLARAPLFAPSLWSLQYDGYTYIAQMILDKSRRLQIQVKHSVRFSPKECTESDGTMGALQATSAPRVNLKAERLVVYTSQNIDIPDYRCFVENSWVYPLWCLVQ